MTIPPRRRPTRLCSLLFTTLTAIHGVISFGCGSPRPSTQPPTAQRPTAQPPAAPSRPPAIAPPRIPAAPAPPAGIEPCDGRSSPTALEAARHCHATRIRPALLRLAAPESERTLARMRLGAREYLADALTIAPTFGLVEQLDGASVRRRYLEGMPRELLTGVIVEGSLDRVHDEAQYALVHVESRRPDWPVDGGLTLVFVVEVATRSTVLVFRLLHG